MGKIFDQIGKHFGEMIQFAVDFLEYFLCHITLIQGDIEMTLKFGCRALCYE